MAKKSTNFAGSPMVKTPEREGFIKAKGALPVTGKQSHGHSATTDFPGKKGKK